MKFSLIICTYMRPKAILKLLNSVQLQTLYPTEIIVIDGSTTNETKDILEQNSIKNLNYFLVSDADRGLTKQRNYGIKKVAKDIDIVCFLDDDTVLNLTYFEELIKTYSIYPDAKGVGGYINNEVVWSPLEAKHCNKHHYCIDGFVRTEGIRFKLRKLLRLIDETPPGFMPVYSNGRSISYLPPSNKVYPVEFFMGGVASFKKEVFQRIQFSIYFEGYGLYEDLDFCLRASQLGQLYVNTSAQLEHHHEEAGRPNKFRYGKMVVRNGWYVWRVKYPHPNLKARIKWNLIMILLLKIRFLNVFTTTKRKEAFTEGMGRLVGWFSLFLNKPKQ